MTKRVSKKTKIITAISLGVVLVVTLAKITFEFLSGLPNETAPVYVIHNIIHIQTKGPNLEEFTFLATIACLWIIMAGIGTAIKKIMGDKIGYPLARVVSCLPVILLFNTIEHTVGLGKNWGHGPLLLLTLTSGGVIWSEWKKSTPSGRRERAFIEGAFAVGLLITYILTRNATDITSLGQERVRDLSVLASWSQGTSLPPDDAWMPGFTHDYYYALGHYAGGIARRLGNLELGQGYYATLLLACAWASCGFMAAAWTITRGNWKAATLATMTVVMGANLTPLAALIMTKVAGPTTSMRFVLENSNPWHGNLTPLGKKISEDYLENPKMHIPAKSFAFLTQSGELMPPTMGMVLLAMLLTALTSTGKKNQECQSQPWHGAFWAGITLSAIPPTNMWLALPAGLITTCWIGGNFFLDRTHGKKAVTGLIVGGLTGGLLLLPTLTRLGANISESGTALKMTGTELAPTTPLWAAAVVFGPSLLWIILALIGHIKKEDRNKMVVAAGAISILLLFIEKFYVDDYLDASFERWNTYLKWAPIIMASSAVTCGALAFASSRTKWVAIAMGILVTVPTFAIHLGSTDNAKESHGDWSGKAWIKQTTPELLNTLESLPPGIVLELEGYKGNFTLKSLGMLTGHKTWIGWPGHINLHKVKHPEANRRKALAYQFYQGNMKNVGEWAIKEKIDYIVWCRKLHEKYEPSSLLKPDYLPQNFSEWVQPHEAWEAYNTQFRKDFTWIETSAFPKEGVWIKTPSTKE